MSNQTESAPEIENEPHPSGARSQTSGGFCPKGCAGGRRQMTRMGADERPLFHNLFLSAPIRAIRVIRGQKFRPKLR